MIISQDFLPKNRYSIITFFNQFIIRGSMGTLNSFLGIIVLLFIAFLFSSNKRAINVRTVLGALALQVAIGALVLYVPAGRDALNAMATGVSKVISYGNGRDFIFIRWLSQRQNV